MKLELFTVKPEYCYGDDKEAKRQKQLDTLASLGLTEDTVHGFALCDAAQAIALVRSGYCGHYFSHEEYIKPVYSLDTGNDMAELIGAAIERSIAAASNMFNNVTQCEAPGPGLMDIQETMLMEDACTDGLQENLANGWRILAVCPQPKRRPDYVLGRPNPAIPKSAARG